MLTELHTALQRLLEERGGIPAEDVDVTFDPPVKAWLDARTRPTVNLFLFEIEENTELRDAALQTGREAGRGTHRMPPRRFDLHYLVSALTTEYADEHLLLWRSLVTLLRHPELPAELLPDAVLSTRIPIVGKVTKPDGAPRTLDIWATLDVSPRPALLYVLTVPVDLEFATQSPLVLTRTARYADGSEARTHIGGVVRDAHGVPQPDVRVRVHGSAGAGAVTRADGTFALHGVPRGNVTLRVERTDRAPTLTTLAIPSDSYEVVVD
jgi:hypothetical protein